MFNVICVIKEDLFWFNKDKILERSRINEHKIPYTINPFGCVLILHVYKPKITDFLILRCLAPIILLTNQREVL